MSDLGRLQPFSDALSSLINTSTVIMFDRKSDHDRPAHKQSQRPSIFISEPPIYQMPATIQPVTPLGEAPKLVPKAQHNP
jgi:hypothetical protein